MDTPRNHGGAFVLEDGYAILLWFPGRRRTPRHAFTESAKAIPLKDGYFEMLLPRAIFESNPKAITVNWTDFCR